MIGLKDAKTSLNTHIDSAGNTAIDLGYIGKAIENLPDATTHKGIFFHVTDLDEYFWSDGVEWTNEKSSVYNVSLWTWGHNVFGQLGDNTTVSKKSPVTTAGGGTNWNNIAAGNEHILATKRDGTLWTWGRNLYGQLGDNTVTTRSSPITTIGGGTTWDKFAGGNYHSIATKTDGTLWTWGYNLYGQLGDNTTDSRLSPITTIGGGTTWDKVAAGNWHSIATKTDGTLWTWGRNSYGQLGDGTTTSRLSPGTTSGGGTNWDKVGCGQNHCIATKTDGTLWTWGRNLYGALGDNTITAKSSPVTTAGGGTTWDKVAGGLSHTLATKTDGTLWTWGHNANGQLGDNTTTSRLSPVTTIGGGTTWAKVAGGYNHCVATKTDGTLWTWGNNGLGELGDNTTVNKSSPITTAGGGTNWDKVASHKWHSVSIQVIYDKGF
jgi:alpha-tubulin suppressor-like RCC1 family protein